MRLCACGCGEEVRSPNARFIQGHHAKTKTKNPPKRDWTGYSCKHCGVILTDKTHSNRSKLNDSSDPNRRAWRICKDCLSSQKKSKRDHQRMFPKSAQIVFIYILDFNEGIKNITVLFPGLKSSTSPT